VEATGNKWVIYEFGKFVLDPKERTLLADGVSVHLQSKEFDTLLLLVEHNGHVLTKEEMIAVIWPDSIVEEGNLAKRSPGCGKYLTSTATCSSKRFPSMAIDSRRRCGGRWWMKRTK
jgi:hypothetical protein